jgi:AGZA family xanthine/uracil permease-like MFS transporter
MIREVKNINFMDLEEAFPSFIIMVMIALSYSISTGLAFGFVSFVITKTVSGKARDIRPVMWIIAFLSVMFLMFDKLPAIIEYLKGGKTL